MLTSCTRTVISEADVPPRERDRGQCWIQNLQSTGGYFSRPHTTSIGFPVAK